MKRLHATEVIADAASIGPAEATPRQWVAGDSSHTHICRRTFLKRGGLGSLALAALVDPALSRVAAAAAFASANGQPAVPWLARQARVKRVIFLYMAGGPSHVECFDNKPQLA